MKRLLLLLVVFTMVLAKPSFAQSDNETADLFKVKCGICHTIGGGKLVGPDLINVQDKRSEEWLMTYIRSSQTMINNGDPDAVALYEEYNKVVMPDPMISDAEIKSLLVYITEQSVAGGSTSAKPVSMITDATTEDFEHGKDLFEGRVRFENGGPSCISCHNDLSKSFFAENSLSTKDISASFSILGEPGVTAILKSPPFPLMTEAFKGHNLTDDEIRNLLIFLKDASKPKSTFSSGYLLYGILGAFALLVVYGGLWYKRKDKSVNHSIYKRQIKSFN